MEVIAFDPEDFEILELIDKFNQEHWKGGTTTLGWNYDVPKNSAEILKIKSSLHKIQNKLSTLRSYLSEKEGYKGLTSSVQKITDGRTNRYLHHLWLYFIKRIESKPPNEPQLQVSINSQCLEISLWFENSRANEKYLSNIINTYSKEFMEDDLIALTVFEAGIAGRELNRYSNKQWDKFIDQITGLGMNCKVGFSYFIPKKEAISKGNEVIKSIETYLDRLRPIFNESALSGERFIMVHIEWNDHGWTAPQIPDRPFSRYAKGGHVPHESLNFKFDKSIDTSDKVYGFFQPGRGTPRGFLKSTHKNKMIFFLSRRRIVGIYGDADFLDKPIKSKYDGFENGTLTSNISGKRGLSFRFLKEAYLRAIPEYMNNKRMGQSIFIYITLQNAERIIKDAIDRYVEIINADPQNNEAREHRDKLSKLEGLLSALSGNIQIIDQAEVGFCDLLASKKQVILYGPPGTGKTYKTKDLALKFIKGS
jgi:Cdc6-like AAA superfamily ATPase